VFLCQATSWASPGLIVGGGHTYVLWYFSFSVIMVALDNHGDMDPSGLGLFSYACLSMGWFYEICCLYSPLVY
jgi:hypothetical protein